MLGELVVLGRDSAALVSWQTPLRLVGGVVLVYLGVTAVLSEPSRPEVRAEMDSSRGYAGLYASAVGLTLTNPMTIMAFGLAFQLPILLLALGGQRSGWRWQLGRRGWSTPSICPRRC